MGKKGLVQEISSYQKDILFDCSSFIHFLHNTLCHATPTSTKKVCCVSVILCKTELYSVNNATIHELSALF